MFLTAHRSSKAQKISMPASLPTLPDHPVYDIAIIGGGIAGAGIALEASRKNLKVILFEKSTFGSGTSSKSSKLIHGGLRYLETAWSALLKLNLFEFWKNLRFVFLALHETHILARAWPDLIHDIELFMPIYKNQGRSRFAAFFGTWIYGFLSLLGGGKHKTCILGSAEAALKMEPSLEKEGLIGAVLVWDHTTDDLALVRRIIQTAQSLGAKAMEHSPVTSYLYDSVKKIFTVKVSGTVYYAKHIINAGGAWADQIRSSATHEPSEMIVPVAGAHIQAPIFSRNSCILQAPDNRIFFIINRGGQARIGTTERIEKNPDHVAATKEEVDYLLAGVRTFFPDTAPSKEKIISTDAGIRPLAKPARTTAPEKISREHEFIKDKNGAIHVLGVKLTDHRRAARELLKRYFSV